MIFSAVSNKGFETGFQINTGSIQGIIFSSGESYTELKIVLSGYVIELNSDDYTDLTSFLRINYE